MRVLVLSDSHGDVYKLRRAIDSQPTAKLIVFLGDGEYDIDSVECRVPVIKVRQLRFRQQSAAEFYR